MRSREAYRPMRDGANPPVYQWDVLLEVLEEHWLALMLVTIALFLVWKEYSLFWQPHGW